MWLVERKSFQATSIQQNSNLNAARFNASHSYAMKNVYKVQNRILGRPKKSATKQEQSLVSFQNTNWEKRT